jgi:hypothetical protein
MNRAISIATARKVEILFAKVRDTRCIGVNVNVSERRRCGIARVRKNRALAEDGEHHQEHDPEVRPMHGVILVSPLKSRQDPPCGPHVQLEPRFASAAQFGRSGMAGV